MELLTIRKLALLFLLAAHTAEARELNVPDGPHLATMGRGTVTVPADRAVIELTATGRDQTAVAAKNAVENMIAALLDGLSALKMPAEQYRIGGLQLDREMDYQRDKEVVLGYLAERSVTVTVNDTASIDPVLQAALTAGISQVDSVTFSLSKWAEVKQRARTLAVNDTKQKSQYLAAQFGGCLGDVYSIDTSSDRDDGTLSEIIVTARKREESSRVPEYVSGQYDAGQVEVKAELMVVFRLRMRDCS